MRGVAIEHGEKTFVLASLERARSERVFDAMEELYSAVPRSTCERRAFCCRGSPRIYFVEFLNLYRGLMELPRHEQLAVQQRSIRYAFLDLCDPALSCPLLEENRCLLYGSRGLRCRLWGHESREAYDLQVYAAKKNMAEFCRFLDRYGLNIPVEVLAFQPPYCQVKVLDSEPLSDDGADRLEERLRLLEQGFIGTSDPEERYVDFSRHLYTTFFDLKGYGALRVRVMRDYLERSSEKALKPVLELVRAMTLAHTSH